ncbi:MAG: iron ABC transporter permease [Gemmatimonadetes bacterium]|nr:iron ABC transporter permease [Gemmatimonadota bacterium]
MSGRGSSAGTLLVLVAALLLAVILSLGLGTVRIEAGEVWRALFGAADGSAAVIVRDLRLPRALLAATVGAALGASGAALQVSLRNPLAEPYLLGVSGGAAVGAVTAVTVGVAGLGGIAGFAFLGAMLAVGLVLVLGRGGGSERLLMAGVVTGTFANAVIMVLLSDAGPTAQRGALWWMMGSVAVAQWRDVAFLAVALVLAGGALLHQARALDLLALGPETAASLGVQPERVVQRTFVLASLLAATTVATAGLVGFVGLMVPHLARRWQRHQGVRVTMGVAALLGAILVLLADLIARLARSPAELPLGAITALFGVPFFFWLLRSSR